jgi:outer membrane protein OmpA-like peptidoglycan-associated protein
LAAAAPQARPILPPRSSQADNPALSEFASVLERARASAGRSDGSLGRDAAVTPVPITFVTGSSAMTAEGARAADLLAQYLGITKPEAVTLSGHADIRGGDVYNLELSRQRLLAIETYLRQRGYTGRLSLLPKGKAEPYQGIDRSSQPIEVVYQADRRVELRVAE